MKKPKYIWHDGKIMPWEKAVTHVATWTLHYGVGVFEGMRAYEGKGNSYIVRLGDHVQRLIESAKIYQIPLKYSKNQIEEAVLEIVRKNEHKSCYIRPLLFYGEMEKLGLDPGKTPTVLSIFTVDFGRYLGEDALEKGIKCGISSWRRQPPFSVPTLAKCGANYANAHIAKMEALREGYGEAIMTDFEGYASEGSAENLFMVEDGVLVTPPEYESILKGVTRDCIIQIAKDEGIEVKERQITHGQLFVADELFFSGTAGEVTPINNVDGRKIGNEKRGPITKRLQEIYFDAVNGNNEKYKHWVTKVY